MNEPYYNAYEKRYQAVFSAGVKRWGHSPAGLDTHGARQCDYLTAPVRC